MRRSWSIALVLAAATAATVAACGKNEKPPPAATAHINQESGPPSRQPNEGARAYFQQTCSLCHGVDGTGNGPMAAQLNPRPRNYTDPTWQASVSDDDIKQIIVAGSAAVGKSGGMPPNPGLKEDLVLLDGLVKIVRGFAKK
jgi:cytochrome c553